MCPSFTNRPSSSDDNDPASSPKESTTAADAFARIHLETARIAYNQSLVAAEAHIAALSAADRQSIIDHLQDEFSGELLSRGPHVDHLVNTTAKGSFDFRYLTSNSSPWNLDPVFFAALFGELSYAQHFLRPLSKIPRLKPALSWSNFWERARRTDPRLSANSWSRKFVADLLKEYQEDPNSKQISGGLPGEAKKKPDIEDEQAEDSDQEPVFPRRISQRKSVALPGSGEETQDEDISRTAGASKAAQQGLKPTDSSRARSKATNTTVIILSSDPAAHHCDGQKLLATDLPQRLRTENHVDPAATISDRDDDFQLGRGFDTSRPTTPSASNTTYYTQVSSQLNISDQEVMASHCAADRMRLGSGRPAKRRRVDAALNELSKQCCSWEKQGPLPEDNFKTILKFLSISCRDFVLISESEQAENISPTTVKDAATVIFIPQLQHDRVGRASYAWADVTTKQIYVWVSEQEYAEEKQIENQLKTKLNPTHPDSQWWEVQHYDTLVPAGDNAFFALTSMVVFNAILRRPCEGEAWLIRRWLSSLFTSSSRPALTTVALQEEAQQIDLTQFKSVLEAECALNLMKEGADHLHDCLHFLAQVRVAFRKILTTFTVPETLPAAAQSSAFQDEAAQQALQKRRDEEVATERWFAERRNSLHSLISSDEADICDWLDVNKKRRDDFLEQLRTQPEEGDKALWDKTSFRGGLLSAGS